MSLPATVQTLVVGAGPTGLAAAAALAQSGLRVALIDPSERNYDGSRAAVVHSRTLEVLDPIGLADPLIENGTRVERIVFRGTTNILLELDLSLLRDATKYPFSLIIPQQEVERIFLERLPRERVQVFRNKAVVGLRQADDEGAGVEVTFEDGSVTRTQYVIGADGSRSTIRSLAGIEFKDPDTGVAYDDSTVPPAFHVVLADVQLAEPLPEPLPRAIPSAHLDNFLLLIPLPARPPAAPLWRIAYGIPAGAAPPPQEPSLEYLQLQMDARNPWGVRIAIAAVATASRYKVRAAVADRYFRAVGGGYVLLAGDAAHVHSPAGGQGMNLGICDAVALADAVRAHVDAKVAVAAAAAAADKQTDAALRAYSDSRRRIGIRVLGLTKVLTLLINAHQGWRRLLRDFVLQVVSYLPYVNRFAAWRISGLVNRDG